MLKPTDPTTWKYRIAAFNQRLHQNSVCPGNHDVRYANGWYYLDGEPRQRPEITTRAKELEEDPQVAVFFNESYNTYVLSLVTRQHEPAVPVLGEVLV